MKQTIQYNARYLQAIALLMCMLLTQVSTAASPEAQPALSGYDVVSYFTEKKAERGSAEHAVTHAGSTYWFTSAEHKALFSKHPQRYLPQYDGYCAYGIRYGQMVEADPQAWIIVDDKLYLHTDHSFLEKWQADTAAAIKEGDEQWQVLRN